MVGGDYFDYIPMQDDGFGIAVADSSGHGLGAALLTAELQATLQALACTYRDMGEILTLANRILSRGMPEGRFTALTLARIDPRAKVLVYSNAGHPSAYILDAAGEIRGELTSIGLPLGIQSDHNYTSSGAIFLKEGDTVVLYSDGVFEAPSADGTRFGTRRLLETVRTGLHLPAREIVDCLHRRVAAHCRPAPLVDDMTTVVVKVCQGSTELKL
jgi:serine phosphatase RsbU (regulator of sigma subunit)